MLKSRLGVERHQIGYPSGMVAALNGHSQFQGDYIVEISESGKIKQPVFPAYNVSWDDVRNALIYESKAYKVGDSISLTGGGVASDTDYKKENNVYIPKCPNSSIFVVAR